MRSCTGCQREKRQSDFQSLFVSAGADAVFTYEFAEEALKFLQPLAGSVRRGGRERVLPFVNRQQRGGGARAVDFDGLYAPPADAQPYDEVLR